MAAGYEGFFRADYNMRFGVTLGDGVRMPREIMVLEMGIRRHWGTTAEPIVKALSELPVLYLDNRRYRYAYYSLDAAAADGVEFEPMRVQVGAGATHDTRQWPYLTNYPLERPAHAIMLCDRSDAIEAPTRGTCLAIHSREGAIMQASHRQGALYDLTMIAAVNHDPREPLITDYDWHMQRRLVVVGNPATVSAGIAWADGHLDPAGWRRW